MGFFFPLFHLFFPVHNFKIKGYRIRWQTHAKEPIKIFISAIAKQSGKIIQFLFLNKT